MLELPDWEYWSRMRDISLRDALVLSINLCPNEYNHEQDSDEAKDSAQKYWNNLQIAKSHIYGSDWLVGRVSKKEFDVDAAFTTVDLPKFSKWAVTDVKLVGLPQEMRILGGETLLNNEIEISSTQTDDIVAPLQKSQVAGNAILNAIRQEGYDPLKLPATPAGKKGVKDEMRKILQNSPLFRHGTVFNNTWSKLLESEQIRYA